MAMTINPKRVQQALDNARQNAERTNGGWMYLEQIGRCLRYLQDPDAAMYFRQAARQYPLFAESVESQAVLANLYRLADEWEQARRHYQHAYDLLMPLDLEREDNIITLDRLALCAYMLGDDPLTIAAVTRLRPMCRKDEWLTTFTLAALAEARQSRTVARAQEMVQTTEAVIRKRRYQLWSEGSMLSPWDTYAEARRVVRELGGDPDAPPEAA